MWDDDDHFGNPAFPQVGLEQEEIFLKRKSALLEEFSRNGAIASSSLNLQKADDVPRRHGTSGG